uniref:Putative ATPase domain containing protein n=1 Tax=viral metagenome TaxID=1070528 RepID=A0A6M3J3Y8_9ZZZZ
MSDDFIWVTDKETGESYPIHYNDIEESLLPQIFTPVGGFCYSAESFIRLPLSQVPFFLGGWLPRQGKMEIYGQPKSGKSFLALQLARCIGVGEDFVGMPTNKAKVLYLQFELGARVLQERMQNTGRDYSNVYVGTTFSMKLDTPMGQGMLIEALAATEPKVLILDPFYKILQGDENESQDVQVVIDFLDSMIDQFECSVVIMHHPGKDLSKGGRGSSVLGDWVDSYIEMRRIRGENGEHRVKLTPKLLRHSEIPPEPLEAIMGGDFEFWVDGQAGRTIYDKLSRFFVEKKDEEVSIQEILAQGFGQRKATHDAINTLLAQGKATRVRRGVYKWLSAGLTITRAV